MKQDKKDTVIFMLELFYMVKKGRCSDSRNWFSIGCKSKEWGLSPFILVPEKGEVDKSEAT
jgi:hypothetical protein